MPRRRNGEIPLPDGWDFAQDYDGKVYFIDHNSKQTTWIDPRDRLVEEFEEYSILLHLVLYFYKFLYVQLTKRYLF